ncbi:MAG TPA: hypothetical protein VFZ08_14655 [Terriglobia bacterium]|nr:hypothetical protein [Terriglobia bacterium]
MMPERAERTDTLNDSVAEGALKASQPPETEVAAHFHADLLEYLIANSLGSDPAVLALHRYLPVEIYLEGEPADLDSSVALAVVELVRDGDLKELGFEVHSVGPCETGSLRIKFVLRSLERLTLEGVRDLTERIKAACEDSLNSTPGAPEPGKENKQTTLIDAQILQAKVTAYAAAATFIITLLSAAVAGYINWGHLRAEKRADQPAIILRIEPSSRAFTVPGYPQQPPDRLEQQGGQEL